MELDCLLNQTAVLWRRSRGAGSPDKFGNYTYATPVEITCRWENRRREFFKADRTVVIANGRIYSTSEIQTGDRFKLGALLTAMTADWTVETDVAEVLNADTSRSVDATETLYTGMIDARL